MHEEKAYQVLKTYFLVEVTEPVRLHVEAKRYLCTTDSGYMAQLSPTSVKSFHDQGGKMSVAELQEFEQNAYHRDALLLRRWDDQAKEPDKLVPGIETYLPMLQACILPDLQQK
jgi:gamma-butyrobetaine dioxygenase